MRQIAKKAMQDKLAALADQVYAASEPSVRARTSALIREARKQARAKLRGEPVHVPGELDHLDEPQDRDGGPDTWTDAERNL